MQLSVDRLCSCACQYSRPAIFLNSVTPHLSISNSYRIARFAHGRARCHWICATLDETGTVDQCDIVRAVARVVLVLHWRWIRSICSRRIKVTIGVLSLFACVCNSMTRHVSCWPITDRSSLYRVRPCIDQTIVRYSATSERQKAAQYRCIRCELAQLTSASEQTTKNGCRTQHATYIDQYQTVPK